MTRVPESIFSPDSPQAQAISHLFIVSLVVFAAIFAAWAEAGLSIWLPTKRCGARFRFSMRPARLLRLLPLFLACASMLRAAPADPQAAPQGLYDALLQAMKQGPSLGFSGRVKLIGPAVRSSLDLPFMARLTAGPAWQAFTPQQQRDFVQAFSDYSVAVYAARFKSYSGERFVVDSKATPRPNGDVIVHTQIVFTGGGDPVKLDYLERNLGGQWRIVDIFLGGTISQVATQYSEYSATIARGGAPALIELLKQKTGQLK